jgi:hypothetical protein
MFKLRTQGASGGWTMTTRRDRGDLCPCSRQEEGGGQAKAVSAVNELDYSSKQFKHLTKWELNEEQ